MDDPILLQKHAERITSLADANGWGAEEYIKRIYNTRRVLDEYAVANAYLLYTMTQGKRLSFDDFLMVVRRYGWDEEYLRFIHSVVTRKSQTPKEE